ncbi:Calcium-transporting ATPase 4, endoplasmic reticulum-type [Camellia lanceoleosa]|uniref:Calcium-transporting ATPase 4, endoplasmic reticulum-type n=1 Tax=Camellia lanceoleosa TaxID=1840588 RepID=A0ACC0IAX7_9ERIC|nr:Calcium-transporting ATPase 4, endoplasmic reticulum-type [Camellia lanceoleosa]
MVNMKYFAEAATYASTISEMIERVPAIDSEDQRDKTIIDVRGDLEFKDIDFAYPSRPTHMVMVEKMGLPDGLDSGTSKGYGDVLRCCRTWSKIERWIATLEFDHDRKSMGVIVSSSSRRKSLLVKEKLIF